MLDIINLTRKKPPKFPWQKIKEKILDKKYSLSLVFADDSLMKKLNRRRGKNTAANTLSFNLSSSSGEIFLNVKNSPEYLRCLFIHSLLHLKGLKHGRKMDMEQEKFLKKFSLQ